MLFNSWQFALFLPIVFALYWSFPHRFRWLLLLLASYYFYMSWNVRYVVLILFTTLISYISAILIERTNSRLVRKYILALTLLACLGVLFVFKYFNFISQSLADFLSLFTIHLHPMTLTLMLPVGISFYTFQTLGYVIDVYRGTTKAERHFGIYATFISFFPQLVAGPIERTNNLLPQIKARHEFNYEQGTYGLKLIAWGLFKKLIIADKLAYYVDRVFNYVYGYKGFSFVVAAFFFTIQIYCDFSGYSDIARGSAKLFGIELMENFGSPYYSSSLREFWSRWHISLSTWFRDYVYIPLGGNRKRHYLNVMLTFMVSGLWHGANWTFVVWGAVHGVGQVLEDVFARREQHKLSMLRWLMTSSFCVLAWTFFRARSLADVLYIFEHIFDNLEVSLYYYTRIGFRNMSMSRSFAFYLCIMMSFLISYDYLSYKGYDVIELLTRKNIFIRWFIYLLIGLAIVFLSSKGVATEFIYFQF